MSQESLEQFVNEEFLRQGSTQDRLKATNSLDNFIELMVSLGNVNYSFTADEVKTFLQKKIDDNKKKIQDKTDLKKAEIEAKNVPIEAKIEAKEAAQKIAEQEKKQIDDDWENVVAHWDRQTVESGIAYLRNDPVLPIYP
ncbi:hypothetical protein [Nostoc sp. LPT]|uniref:hypothetical protein n=1 Tax=Nostoc sp. LPT TaxID=2815387 RepID=UPI001D7260CA|nr:hypothetical protein [Nostoc sp. LPT]MBN4003832.1 hypothetical protein [Nostoc sp. LPT]